MVTSNTFHDTWHWHEPLQVPPYQVRIKNAALKASKKVWLKLWIKYFFKLKFSLGLDHIDRVSGYNCSKKWAQQTPPWPPGPRSWGPHTCFWPCWCMVLLLRLCERFFNSLFWNMPTVLPDKHLKLLNQKLCKPHSLLNWCTIDIEILKLVMLI